MPTPFQRIEIVIPGPGIDHQNALKLQKALIKKNVLTTIIKRSNMHSFHYTIDGAADNSLLVVNWGSQQFKQPKGSVTILNHDPNIENKRTFFQDVALWNFNDEGKTINVPEYYISGDDPNFKQAIMDDEKIVCMAYTAGRGGSGMSVYDPELFTSTIPKLSRLFTKYIPKTDEYRAHIDEQLGSLFYQKKIRVAKEADYQIRSPSRGWRWKTLESDEILKIPGRLWPQLQHIRHFLAVKKLAFCAVDFIFSQAESKCYVTDINLSPDLDETGVEMYSTALKNRYQKGW